MSAYVLTLRAVADLDEIWSFIADESPDAADRVVDELESAMEQIALRPAIGHRREDLTKAAVRFWRVRSYLIVYDPQTGPLQILRVLSGFRDISAIL